VAASASPSVQQRFNERTQERWEEYAHHRARVCRLLADANESGRASQTLCVLGAGNCNDLDLRLLAERFDSIALVDIDTDAVRAALERQGVHSTAKIAVIGADLLGPRPPLPKYDVVLSSCVLSQLIAESERQGASPEEQLALRRKHCVDATELTSPGGTFLLVTDFVADATVPELMQLPDYRLAELVQRLAGERNFFNCLNPIAVEAFLASDPALRAAGQLLGRRRLWRWDMGEVAYLVAGWRWQRRSSA